MFKKGTPIKKLPEESMVALRSSIILPKILKITEKNYRSIIQTTTTAMKKEICDHYKYCSTMTARKIEETVDITAS